MERNVYCWSALWTEPKCLVCPWAAEKNLTKLKPYAAFTFTELSGEKQGILFNWPNICYLFSKTCITLLTDGCLAIANCILGCFLQSPSWVVVLPVASFHLAEVVFNNILICYCWPYYSIFEFFKFDGYNGFKAKHHWLQIKI